jgi:hypothetical protein
MAESGQTLIAEFVHPISDLPDFFGNASTHQKPVVRFYAQ